MIGISLALLSAFSWGIAVVLIRQKIGESNILSASSVCIIISGCIIWPLSLLFTNLEVVNFESVLVFALAGVLAPGIVNLIYNKGMNVIGVSVSASIFATYPMFSAIFAILLLGERFIVDNFVGIILILVGVWIIERGLSKPEIISKKNVRKGLIFPLLASLTMAFSFIPRKHGLNIYNEPLLAVAIGLLSSSLFYILLSKSSRRMRARALFSGKDLKLFWKASIFMSLGMITSLFALSYEDISIVTPLMQTEPLFVLFLAYLFLKEPEQRSSNLLLGTILIIIGVILVSLK